MFSHIFKTFLAMILVLVSPLMIRALLFLFIVCRRQIEHGHTCRIRITSCFVFLIKEGSVVGEMVSELLNPAEKDAVFLSLLVDISMKGQSRGNNDLM